jgi:hypothetical protein
MSGASFRFTSSDTHPSLLDNLHFEHFEKYFNLPFMVYAFVEVLCKRLRLAHVSVTSERCASCEFCEFSGQELQSRISHTERNRSTCEMSCDFTPLDIENAHCILHGEKGDQRSKATVVLFEVALTKTVFICHVLASNLATPSGKRRRKEKHTH